MTKNANNLNGLRTTSVRESIREPLEYLIYGQAEYKFRWRVFWRLRDPVIRVAESVAERILRKTRPWR